MLARLSLSAIDRNLAHWSQLGPAGAFSTSFESWGSTQRGKGIVRIWVDAIVGQRENRVFKHVALRIGMLRHASPRVDSGRFAASR